MTLSVQVLEWTQTILGAGEAFCGSESATLRDALRRQSGRFFAAFHSANLQARTQLPPDPEAAARNRMSESCCCLTRLLHELTSIATLSTIKDCAKQEIS